MIVLLAVASYLLDRATKFFAFQYLPPFASVPIVNNVLYLVRVHNTGAAFGMFRDRNRLFAMLALAALAAIGILLVQGVFHTPLRRWGISL